MDQGTTEGFLQAKTTKDESYLIHKFCQLLALAISMALMTPESSAIKEEVLPKNSAILRFEKNSSFE
jgi:hypothetical protein